MLFAAVLVVAVAAVTSRGVLPDISRAVDALTGRELDGTTETALVAWLCIAALVLAALASVPAGLPPGPWRRRPGWVVPACALALGGLVLGLGLAHHAAGSYHVCCADPGTSREVQDLVR